MANDATLNTLPRTRVMLRLCVSVSRDLVAQGGKQGGQLTEAFAFGQGLVDFKVSGHLRSTIRD